MNIKALTVLIFTVNTLVIDNISAQTPPGDSVTNKRLSILNDKYSLAFPSAAKNIPRVADIMAADPNLNRETRIIYENGSHKLVFFAQELYALSGKNLFKDMQAEIQPEFNFTRQLVKDEDSIIIIQSTPSTYDSTGSAILVNSLLIKSPDNTVSRVDAFINPEAFSKKEYYSKIADEIFKSFEKGNRRIDLHAKQETYTIFGTTAKLSFQLPANYYVTVDEKYDFGVFKINKYKKDITDTTYSGISIYCGHHPNFFHADYGYKFEQATKSAGKFLQIPVDWMYFKDEAQSFYLKEQIFLENNIEKGMVLHVAMLSNKKEILEELNKIVESVKLLK
jgi:hypothetical protein